MWTNAVSKDEMSLPRLKHLLLTRTAVNAEESCEHYRSLALVINQRF